MNPAYEFWEEDFIREAPERLEKGKIAIRAQKLFTLDTMLKNKGQQMAYSLGNSRQKITKSD